MAKYSPYEALARYEKSGFFTALPATSINADVTVKHDAGRQFNGVIIELIVTNASTLTLTPKLQVVDDAGNVLAWWAATANVTANGTYTYVFVQQGGAAGLASLVVEKVDLPLPRGWQLFLDISAGSYTGEVHIAYV